MKEIYDKLRKRFDELNQQHNELVEGFLLRDELLKKAFALIICYEAEIPTSSDNISKRIEKFLDTYNKEFKKVLD
jgi:GTPase SAR1 family protein